MNRTTRPAAIVLGLALALLTLAPAGASVLPRAEAGDGEVSWSVEPVADSSGERQYFEYDSDPGTQIVDSVVITNSGSVAADFIVYATDAINEVDTGAFSLLPRDTAPKDIGSWITLATDSIRLEPGLQATVPFNLLVPSDATPGDHVAGIVAAVITEGESGGSAIELEQRVGARVYLSVSGAIEPAVEVGGITSSYTPSLNPFAPGTLTVSYDVRNTGNLRVDVNQRVQANGMFGLPLGKTYPEPIDELLPGQTVRVTTELVGVGAAGLAWANVAALPGAIGSAGKVTVGDETPVAEPTETPTPEATATDAAAAPVIPDQTAVDYVQANGSTFTVAVSWTLLALIVVLALVGYLIWRYLAGARERFYQAIDEAAEAARAAAPSGRREGESNA